VREWRRYHQISLTEFSKRTKLTKGYISELEHNKIDNPKQDKLERMAVALGISVRDILSRRMPDEVKDGKVASGNNVQVSARSKNTGRKEKPNQRIAGKGRALKSATQVKPPPMPTMANPALALPDSLLDTVYERIEAIIKSKHYSEEETERFVVGLIEAAELLSKAIKPQHKSKRKFRL
jgi:transcriptional regulator with XRE-family HTH domain